MPNSVGKTLKDRVILQRWRERDIVESGQSNISNQGITWDNKGKAQEAELERDASHEWRHPQEPPRPLPRGPNPPGGPGEPGESDNGESEDELPQWNGGLCQGCGEHGQIDHRQLAGGDRPPPPPPPEEEAEGVTTAQTTRMRDPDVLHPYSMEDRDGHLQFLRE